MYWLVLSTVLLAILLTGVFYRLQTQQAILIPLKAQPPAILITGPSAAGKTALFSKLAYKHSALKPTYTSRSINSASYTTTANKTVRLVDVPGHPKLQGLLTSAAETGKISKIIFVLDASTLTKGAPAVARLLLDTLTFSQQQSISVDKVVIFANKSDFFTAVDENGVTQALEREVEETRRALGGEVRMEAMEEKGEQVLDWLADYDERFTLANESIQVICGSVLKAKGLDLLQDCL